VDLGEPDQVTRFLQILNDCPLNVLLAAYSTMTGPKMSLTQATLVGFFLTSTLTTCRFRSTLSIFHSTRQSLRAKEANVPLIMEIFSLGRQSHIVSPKRRCADDPTRFGQEPRFGEYSADGELLKGVQFGVGQVSSCAQYSVFLFSLRN
jgi:hypothetical protein